MDLIEKLIGSPVEDEETGEVVGHIEAVHVDGNSATVIVSMEEEDPDPGVEVDNVENLRAVGGTH